MKRLFTLAALSSFSVLLAACDGGSTTSEPNLDPGTPDAGSTTPDAGATPTDVGCPTAHFLDVSKAPGAGSSYAQPTLAVRCTETTLVVTSNGIPHYTFVQVTPNALAAQNHHWTVPRQPKKASQTTDIPLLGPAGFTVNGLPVYGPNEGPMPTDSAYGDPIYNGITDECLGHTARRGDYHYHALLEKCLTERGLVAEPWKLADPAGDKASPVLGYGFDGFPIYGSYECADAPCTQIIKLESSWDMTGNPIKNAWDAYTYSEKTGEGALDRCNGHTGPAGDYHYHATDGFPYILGCYAGTPTNNGGMP
jgi:hypothetical protein